MRELLQEGCYYRIYNCGNKLARYEGFINEDNEIVERSEKI